MSYVSAGGVVDTLKSVVSSASTIIEDPALPQLTKSVLELKAIEQKRGGSTGAKGIGLSEIVKPVQYFVYYKKNRWILPVVAIALLGIPMLIGYSIGKKKRSI
jgi:hypothetical protein